MGDGIDEPSAMADLPAMALRRARFGSRLRHEIGVLLRVSPAVLFVLFTIAVPIGLFLYRAIDNSELHDNLPKTITALSGWQSHEPLEDRHYEALANDLRALGDGPRLYQVARQLNYHKAGYRSAVLKASESVRNTSAGPARALIESADPAWQDHAIWQVIARESGVLTPFFLLTALDLERDESGIRDADPDRALYREVFVRTVWMSLLIAAACVVLGYPLAYFLANTRSRLASLAMYAVLLPFWTSLLVRTLAWIVIFQKGGVAASTSQILGLGTASLLYSRPAVIVGMIHVMLPFMILSIYAVMRGIPSSYTRAAISLGASPMRAFLSVYLPQSMPGIGAGVMIVTILSLGFYLTPALLGSPNDQLISYFIAYFTNELVNWNMAAALAIWLLVFAGCLWLIVRQAGGR
jgi:putative spermidine/putrescine transport system permease protein